MKLSFSFGSESSYDNLWAAETWLCMNTIVPGPLPTNNSITPVSSIFSCLSIPQNQSWREFRIIFPAFAKCKCRNTYAQHIIRPEKFILTGYLHTSLLIYLLYRTLSTPFASQQLLTCCKGLSRFSPACVARDSAMPYPLTDGGAVEQGPGTGTT